MAIVAAARTRDRVENALPIPMFGVVHDGPGAVQRRRTQIVGIARNRVASRITDRTIDALNACIGRDPLRIIRGDLRHWIIPIGGCGMTAASRDPLVEKWIHVDGQILDDRQVSQRRDFNAVAIQNLPDVGPAGPARHAVHHHGAGSAHPHATGKTVTQRRIRVLLHPRYNIQDRLVFIGRHVKRFRESASAAASLHQYFERIVCQRPNFPQLFTCGQMNRPGDSGEFCSILMPLFQARSVEGGTRSLFRSAFGNRWFRANDGREIAFEGGEDDWAVQLS